jgi:hypothetical protein
VELVEDIRPTGKKTVISQRHSQRRSQDGLWHGTLHSGQRRGESTSVWREGRKLRGGEGGGPGGKGREVKVDAVFGRPQIGSHQEIAS